jgi:polar amino acid transport system permease protein
MGVNLLITNEQFQWDVVAHYLFSPVILRGVRLTLELTVMSMAIGVTLGIVLAVMRTSKGRLLQTVSAGYLWFFRGTPLLVQLIFWFNLGALLPELSLGIPFGPSFASWETNSVISPLMAALLGLGLNEAAYMAEVVRAGLLSVDEGQSEAAQALGMRPGLTLRRIVLPQAMRVIIPPTGSRTIQMLKTSSLVSVLALPELLHSAQVVYSRTFQTIPLLVVASIWYLLFTSVLSAIQRRIEAHYARGASRYVADEPQTWKRMRKRKSSSDSTTPDRIEADDD